MTTLRDQIDAAIYTPEGPRITALTETAALTDADRDAIRAQATDLVEQIRKHGDPGLMEVFLAEYGLSTDEGVALMCLAEALLRVPDADTIDALIEDKIAPSDWGKHLGRSSSSLVNASTWGLLLTGRVLADDQPGIVGALRGAVKRLGEPVIRTAVAQAMKQMGRQFVLGETIDAAMDRAQGQESKGFSYSYDMLGEAARTDADARGYLEAYSTAIAAIGRRASHNDAAMNPGISVKLSALHPRYEEAHRARVMAELVPRLQRLAREAAALNLGFNIDAEEADRLSLSLDVIEAVCSDPALTNWQGFGVVVQAYGQRAPLVLDWLYDLAGRSGRRMMVRLVKGAYWDAEIKRAQVLGLDGFPVFTQKSATDISYISNARKMLGMTDRIYPQFATHNAHTVAAVLHMARAMGIEPDSYEFQRLHGMGDVLHTLVLQSQGTRCRIYAPVGAHRDLLAYLVRRLLENGANSSFVNQIVDQDVPARAVAADPWDSLGTGPALRTGPELFAGRRNSAGHDLTHRPTLKRIDTARSGFATHHWQAAPLLVTPGTGPARTVSNPAHPDDTVGTVTDTAPDAIPRAFADARPWDAPTTDRARILRAASDLYETHLGELFALLHREAGKTQADAEGELREAVDFLRYYADQITSDMTPRGTWVCISPWNFPLAIFTGQIAAALAAGNAVIAKPSEETTLIAHRATQLLHDAGVPQTALQLTPGDGTIGAALTSSPQHAGVAFTGSTDTARHIRRSMPLFVDKNIPGEAEGRGQSPLNNHNRLKAAEGQSPQTRPLIAETGGLNAMILDSTALPEHAVRDILQSAFQSAGQRCSALRCLYIQRDIADTVLEMLQGGMTALTLGDPWQLSTDVGPVIDATAQQAIQTHVDQAKAEGRLILQLAIPSTGHFIGPALIRVDGIGDLDREIFGPVLHVATFEAQELDQVIDAINAKGFGLTFGLHTRIDDRVQHVVDRVACGNTYVNRNQIGAIVGSQPFGGEGLSGTGPKAGGPHYVPRFAAPTPQHSNARWDGPADITALHHAMTTASGGSTETRDMPGPTGESNRLTTLPRGPILCLGPGAQTAQTQAQSVAALGGIPVIPGGFIPPDALPRVPNISTVLWWGDAETAQAYDVALAGMDGPLRQLVTSAPDAAHVLTERHMCVDTTASGGNADLLAEVAAQQP